MRQIKSFFLLLGMVIVFSFSGVFTKLAGQEPFLSGKFILLYGCALCLMGLYAIVWQQILRRIPLTTAYAARATGIAWSMVWGLLFFQEEIRWNMVLGAAVIMFGVYRVVTADE